jgi:hypothetical protein
MKTITHIALAICLLLLSTTVINAQKPNTSHKIPTEIALALKNKSKRLLPKKQGIQNLYTSIVNQDTTMVTMFLPVEATEKFYHVYNKDNYSLLVLIDAKKGITTTLEINKKEQKNFTIHEVPSSIWYQINVIQSADSSDASKIAQQYIKTQNEPQVEIINN